MKKWPKVYYKHCNCIDPCFTQFVFLSVNLPRGSLLTRFAVLSTFLLFPLASPYFSLWAYTVGDPSYLKTHPGLGAYIPYLFLILCHYRGNYWAVLPLL